MGLFFKRNRKENNKRQEDDHLSSSAFVQDKLMSADMVSLIKKEQDDMLNPFAENKKEARTVAQKYGTKYIGVSKSQVASSKVVDVRSYVKPKEDEEMSLIEQQFDAIDNEEKNKTEEKPKTSFFDDLLKSLEEDEEDSLVENDVEDIKKEEVKPVKLKFEPKVKPKKKKSVDIDIITGDFGGADIL